MMGVYTGRTAKYTRSARFTPGELAVINDLKAKYRQQPLTERKTVTPPQLLLCAPKIAGLLPAPGHTSSPFTNPKAKLMIGGVVYAVGKGYVMSEIEEAIAAQRKALEVARAA